MENAVVYAVIPAYNEERFVASVVLKTAPLVDGVIVVDDGSADETAALAAAVGAIVVRLERNGGKARAMNAGFRKALDAGADVIVCLDADAQHDPRDIPSVVRPIVTRAADVVIGSRFLTLQNRIPRWRRAGQHTLTKLTNTLSGTRTTDSQSGFRAFSRDAARQLHFHTSGLSVESEMQFLFERASLRVEEVPISVSYRDGNKRNPIVHGLQVLDALLSLVARRRPLLFFALPGAVVAFGGLLEGLVVAWVMQEHGRLMMGTTVLASLMVLLGSLLAVTGIMLHTVGHVVSRVREDIRTMGLERRDERADASQLAPRGESHVDAADSHHEATNPGGLS